MRNEVGTSLVVPVSKIEQFGENHIHPDCDFFETRDRIVFIIGPNQSKK